MTKIGNVLKHLRIAARIKQKKMADQLGISPTYLSMIENGQREPSVEILEKYAASLNVPMAFLVLQSENNPPGLNSEQLELFEQIRKLLFDFQELKSRSASKNEHEKEAKRTQSPENSHH